MTPHDALVDSCEKWYSYPCNLLRPTQLASTLEGYRRSLDLRADRLLNSAREEICFLELQDENKGEDSGFTTGKPPSTYETSTGYEQRDVWSSRDVISHLDLKQKDPKCRFVFLQSANLHSPLRCSRKSFTYISSFHQVPPAFLEFVSSFERTSEPLDYHMTGFNSSINSDGYSTDALSIPELGRSGCEHNVQYLLRAVEPTTKPGQATSWNIQPMAVHHAYDFVTGNALWINVKANALMKDRIIGATKQPSFFGSSTADEQTKTFAATLRTHLVYIEWCDENWRQCINDSESKISDVIGKAKKARILQHLNVTESAPVRAMTGKAATLADLSAEKSIWDLPIMGKIGLGSKPHQQASAGPQLFPALNYPSSTTQPSLKVAKQTLSRQLEMLKVFAFEEIQDLHYQGELLKNYSLVMELNQQTLGDIIEHYQGLLNQCNFSKLVKRACTTEVRSFIARVGRVRKNLQIRITQIKSLKASLEAGKSLFDGILQYQSAQIGYSFTLSTVLQNDKLEKLADKTDRSTMSMHAITVVTLLFLPGTFIATFFQSGLVGFNDYSSGLKDAFVLNPGALKLFFAICLPIMVITLGLWILVFKWQRNKARRRREREHESIVESGESGEINLYPPGMTFYAVS